MSINEMSDKEKSVALARLNTDWIVIDNWKNVVYVEDVAGNELFSITDDENFYTADKFNNPHLSGWAWRVLNWVDDQPDPILISMFSGFWEDVELWQLEPIEAQRMISDKVLEFVDRCGMVKDDIGHVTYRGWSVIDKAYTLYPQENASDRGGEE